MSQKTATSLILVALLIACSACVEHVDVLKPNTEADADGDGDSDGDGDGDGECPDYLGSAIEAPAGDTCATAVPVTAPFLALQVDLSGYTDTGLDGGACVSSQGKEIFLSVTVPPQGMISIYESNPDVEVMISASDGCYPEGDDCWVAPEDDRERFRWFNGGSEVDYEMIVVVDLVEPSEGPAPIELTMIVADPEDVGSCSDPYIIDDLGECSAHVWTATSSHLTQEFHGGEGCEHVEGARGAFFRVTVPPDRRLLVFNEAYLEEGSLIHILDGSSSCGSSDVCLLNNSWDLSWEYVGGGPHDVWVVATVDPETPDHDLPIHFELAPIEGED